MVTCTRIERRYACFPDEAVVTHENLNTATITVTETFAKKKGTFSCQRGDIPVTNQCQFPFSGKIFSDFFFFFKIKFASVLVRFTVLKIYYTTGTQRK